MAGLTERDLDMVEKGTLETVVECQGCQQLMKQPLTLKDCLHSYCQDCLQELPKTEQEGVSGWICNLCKTFSSKAESNVLLGNLAMLAEGGTEDSEASSKEESTTLCQQCLEDEEMATKKCIDCDMDLCDECEAIHLKIPPLQHHKVVPWKQKSDGPIDILIYCKKHPSNKVRFYCKTCNVQICSDCLLTTHNTHTLESPEDAYGRIMPSFKKMVTRLRQRKELLHAQVTIIDNDIDSIEGIQQNFDNYMANRLDKLINRLMEAKLEIEEKVKTQSFTALKNLESHKQERVNEACKFENMINVAEVILKHTGLNTLLNEIQTNLQGKFGTSSQEPLQHCGQDHQIPTLNESKFDVEDAKLLFVQMNGAQGGNLDIQNDSGVNIFNGTASSSTSSASTMSLSEETFCQFQDLSPLRHGEWRKVQSVSVDPSGKRRLSFINGMLWVACSSLKIFTTSGDLEKEVTDKNVTIAREAANQDVIIITSDGIYVTDFQCSKWTLIAQGKYADFSIYEVGFVALRFNGPKVEKFSLKDNSEWKESGSFNLPEKHFNDSDKNGNKNSRIVMIGNTKKILIQRNKSLLIFSEKGDLIHTYTLKWRPLLCGMDRFNHILIQQFNNGAIYITDNLELLTHQNDLQRVQASLRCERAVDAVIDKCGNYWTLVHENQMSSLVKYSAK